MWDTLTDRYKYPASLAVTARGGDHLVERYWQAFLDPQDMWLNTLIEESKCGHYHWGS